MKSRYEIYPNTSRIHLQEESPEAGGSRDRRHRPDDGSSNGRRHERRHPRREHHGEERRQQPHRDLGTPAAAGPFEPSEAEEEQQERGVRGEDEGDGARVAPRVADGERRVERQDGETDLCQRRRLTCHMGEKGMVVRIR